MRILHGLARMEQSDSTHVCGVCMLMLSRRKTLLKGSLLASNPRHGPALAGLGGNPYARMALMSQGRRPRTSACQ
jgi:hypothetical protein